MRLKKKLRRLSDAARLFIKGLPVNAIGSIDGTEQAFARMRAPRIYQKIKQNVTNHPELLSQISCVITTLTQDCIEDLVKEWGPLVRGGIIFDFFTPVTNLDEALWLNWE